MADNLPLALDHETCQRIRERAEVAFKGELRNAIYAWPDATVAQLEHELALAFYRVAMRRLGEAPRMPQDVPESDKAISRAEPETSAYPPPRPVVTGPSPNGSGRWDETEEFAVLAEGTGLNGNGEHKP
jgi:hypothetical protein